MSTTNVWLNSTLSTLASIERWESDINVLSDADSNWNGKIDAAKELLGDQLEFYLKRQRIEVDVEEGEILLDVIANPTTFSVSSDYLTLAIIYEDLSRGDYETLYGQKSKIYWGKYNLKFQQDLETINYDTNLDNTVDIYTPYVRPVHLIR